MIVGGRRLAGEELGELGVKVDEGLGDYLALGGVRVEELRFGQTSENVSNCEAWGSETSVLGSEILERTLPAQVEGILHCKAGVRYVRKRCFVGTHCSCSFLGPPWESACGRLCVQKSVATLKAGSARTDHLQQGKRGCIAQTTR